jgi:hypothetical protein
MQCRQPSLYDELREKCRREARTTYIWRRLGNGGPTRTGAYAMPYNPFERALLRRTTGQRRARLRMVGR